LGVFSVDVVDTSVAFGYYQLINEQRSAYFLPDRQFIPTENR